MSEEVRWQGDAAKRGNLGYRGPLLPRDAANAPAMEALERHGEMCPKHLLANCVDDGGISVIGVNPVGHAASYKRFIYTSSGQSLIGMAVALAQVSRMTSDTGFGDRLRAAIAAAGYKSVRRFAIDAMGWEGSSGPQRMQHYVSGRVPDHETLRLICQKLGLPPSSLLNAGVEDGLRDILLRLLELEGIDPDHADTIASAVLEARRQLETWPEEGELPVRARLAAHAAWQRQRTPGTDTLAR